MKKTRGAFERKSQRWIQGKGRSIRSRVNGLGHGITSSVEEPSVGFGWINCYCEPHPFRYGRTKVNIWGTERGALMKSLPLQGQTWSVAPDVDFTGSCDQEHKMLGADLEVTTCYFFESGRHWHIANSPSPIPILSENGNFHPHETGRPEPQKGGPCSRLNVFSSVGAHFRFSFCFKPMQTSPSVTDALALWPPRLTAWEPLASNGAINQRVPKTLTC